MGKTTNLPANLPKSELIEILHIDTSDSRKLYLDSKSNLKEKFRAQGLLKKQFSMICRKHKGILRNWEGDGGYAFFFSNKSYGNSIDAGEEFLHELDNLNAQTAVALNITSFVRSVRLKAHRGEILLTKNASLDSADPKYFDDFLKYEKIFAPENDELFITKELYGAIPSTKKNRFECYKSIRAGSIKTELYRLKATPVEKTDNIFKIGDKLSEITQDEWNYLKNQIISHRRGVAARNDILKQLIKIIDNDKNIKISSKIILELTLEYLYNYLRVVFKKYKFRISYWNLITINKSKYLKMKSNYYPKNEKPSLIKRKISLGLQGYQLCRAFSTKSAIATPSVVAARKAGNWKDFYKEQKNKKRHLASAFQIPVYFRNNNEDRIYLGVLSIDSDKTDMFLVEEVDLWIDDLTPFLVIIALTEKLKENPC